MIITRYTIGWIYYELALVFVKKSVKFDKILKENIKANFLNKKIHYSHIILYKENLITEKLMNEF